MTVPKYSGLLIGFLIAFLFLFQPIQQIKAFSIENHEAITRQALGFLNEDILNTIVAETPNTIDTPEGQLFYFADWHVDNCEFLGAFDEINDDYDDVLDETKDKEYVEAAQQFGRLLHTVQDFYAHSNWVEILGYFSRHGLFENGQGFWNEELNPYEAIDHPVVPNLMLLEGRSPNGYTLSIEDIFPKVVFVQVSSKTYYGLMSGEAGESGGCPSEVALGHWDTDPNNPEAQLSADCSEIEDVPGKLRDRTGAILLDACYKDGEVFRRSGTGLNKDSLGRPGYALAQELAVEQTTHEWCRLVNLVSQKGGDEAVANLFNEWVDPNQFSEAIAACSSLNIDVMSRVPELLNLEIIQADVFGDLLDLIFVIDTTGSMQDDIDEVKRRALEIINQVAASSSNWQIAIVTYRDHPQSPYGDPGDYVSRVELGFSSDQNSIVNAINGITVGGGGDGPEAVFAGLLEGIAQPWRNGARKVIILMGDAPPHDPDPLRGYTAQTVLQAAYDVDPASIFPILIESQNAVRFPFQVLADGSSGRLFYAANAGEVVPTLLSTIGVATGVQLSIGLEVQIASLEPTFALRTSPSMRAGVIRDIPRSERATITAGPEVVFETSDRNVAQNFIWWQVSTANGEEGWMQETYYGEPILIPLSDSNALTPVTCFLSTRGDANIRSGPGTTFQQIASRADVGQPLAANGQFGNINSPSEHWWQLVEGFWIRNDQVTEEGDCANLPVISVP